MSVPQSERRQSKCEYAVILQQVEQYFVSILGDPECKTYIPGLTEKLFELAADAYNDATLYFEMSIGTVRGDDGQVCIRLNRENIYKHRRRMVKLKGLEERDKLKHENVCLAHKSWMGQVKKYHSKQAVHSVDLQIRRILNHD